MFQWFDVCDSRSKYHKWKKVKCALGVHEELQLAALDKMLKLMDNATFGPNTNKKHFIKGIRCSTNSIKALYHELRGEKWDYLICYRYLPTLRCIIWFQYQHKIHTFLDVTKTNLSRNSPRTEPVEETTTIPVLQTFAIGSDILLYSATQMEFSASAHQLKTRGVKMNLQYPPICREVCSLRFARWTRTRRIKVQNCLMMMKVRNSKVLKRPITMTCHL